VFEPLELEAADTLREGEEVLITISTPVAPLPTDSVMETAGGWKGLVDAENLKRNIYSDRLITTRPPATL